MPLYTKDARQAYIAEAPQRGAKGRRDIGAPDVGGLQRIAWYLSKT